MGKRQEYIIKAKQLCKDIKVKTLVQLRIPFEEEYQKEKGITETLFGDFSIENRLSLYTDTKKIDEGTKATLQAVIAKIKSPDYEFVEADIDHLTIFCKKIDFVIHQCQYITNIYHGENRYVKGQSINLPELFNEIKRNQSAELFFSNTSLDNHFITNGNFKSFLKYFYATIKNCQDKGKYPLYYKFYQNIAYWFFDVERLNYDKYCEFYQSLELEVPKALHFNLYLHLLALNLKMELEKEDMLAEEADKNYIKNNIFNYENSSLDVTLSVEKPIDSLLFENIPPVIPFPTFGWRWATTGIASHLNRPNSLRSVLDAVLINGNGLHNQTQGFKDLLKSICLNKYSMSADDTEMLVKNTNGNPVKNIIENSGNYWTHLGLFSQAGMNAKVSELGINFLTGVLPQDEFIENVIFNYKLPSQVYTVVNTKLWEEENLKIYPFQIILKVLEELHHSHEEEHQYLTEEDLKYIIVPFSVGYDESRIEELVFHILSRREMPSEYNLWPDCYSHYKDDKGERMINEFLYFLECFGYLASSSSHIRESNKQYIATNKLIKLFGVDSSLVGVQKYNQQTKKNQIFFGAPGTGKSFKVKKLTSSAEKANRVFRTTFHPDYDHNSFVGGYKPVNSPKLDEIGIPIPYQYQISYEFIPQIFTMAYIEAWNNLDKDYYLIIEEINRGNCAEIFGDIFQLLDRDDDGYPVMPTKELLDFFKRKLGEQGLEGIDGDKMKLPPNLNLLATMNTSDQSLFPMDSAFKRRWDWIYVPIEYNEFYQDSGKENESFKYLVQSKSSELSFKWIHFIEAINKLIISIPHLGEDKQIGNYFIKGNDINGEMIISLEDFVHKIIFYLWNDVFKDEERDENNIFKEHISYQNFFPIKKNATELVKDILDKLNVSHSSNLIYIDEDIN